MLGLGLGPYGGLVAGEQAAVGHHHPAVDHHRVDVVGPVGVDQLGKHIGAASRGGVQTVAPDYGQIGPLTRLDTTDLALETKGSGAAHGGHVEGGSGGHGPGPGRRLVDQSG